MFLINSFDIIGTISFAISGALIGIEKKLDLFGIIFLAITTAAGGGILRDIIIGTTPPTAFVNPTSTIISIITAILVIFFYEKMHKLGKIIIISDALGLAVFTAIGCRTAVVHGADNVFLVIAMGLSTGVGGGVLRDVFVKNVPLVLKKGNLCHSVNRRCVMFLFSPLVLARYHIIIYLLCRCLHHQNFINQL